MYLTLYDYLSIGEQQCLSQNKEDVWKQKAFVDFWWLKGTVVFKCLCDTWWFDDCNYVNSFFSFSLWINLSHESSLDCCEQSYDKHTGQWFSRTWPFFLFFPTYEQNITTKSHLTSSHIPQSTAKRIYQRDEQKPSIHPTAARVLPGSCPAAHRQSWLE